MTFSNFENGYLEAAQISWGEGVGVSGYQVESVGVSVCGVGGGGREYRGW